MSRDLIGVGATQRSCHLIPELSRSNPSPCKLATLYLYEREHSASSVWLHYRERYCQQARITHETL